MDWFFWINVLRWIIRIGMIPVIIRRRFPPSTSFAWLAVIFLLPIIGLIAYGLLGTQVFGRRRTRRYRHRVRSRQRDIAGRIADQARDRQDPVTRHVEAVYGMPRAEGNDVQFLTDHEAYITNLIDDIDAAEHHVHMLYYIYQPDETGRRVAEALKRAAKRGVKGRVLIDAAGSRPFFRRNGMAAELLQARVEVRAALPVSPFRRRLARVDLRNHRKLVVIDGRTAYAGSHNVINREYDMRPPLPCYDLSARFAGPVVAQLQSVFAQDWTFDTEEHLDEPQMFPQLEPTGELLVQTVPSGPDEERYTLRRVVIAAINIARERLIVTTPYFVPDEHTMLALSMAAYRGVEVHLIVSERTDYPVVSAAGRSYFSQLMEYGVHIYLFNPDGANNGPGGLLHAKTMTIDDHIAMFGSANLDIRSFLLNFELNALLYGPRITGELRTIQDGYMKQSRRIELEHWQERPFGQRFADDAAALLSPLL